MRCRRATSGPNVILINKSTQSKGVVLGWGPGGGARRGAWSRSTSRRPCAAAELRAHVDHRSSVDSVRTLAGRHRFSTRRVIESRFTMRSHPG
jgi:hypothetical protein